MFSVGSSWLTEEQELRWIPAIAREPPQSWVVWRFFISCTSVLSLPLLPMTLRILTTGHGGPQRWPEWGMFSSVPPSSPSPSFSTHSRDQTLPSWEFSEHWRCWNGNTARRRAYSEHTDPDPPGFFTRLLPSPIIGGTLNISILQILKNDPSEGGNT